MTPFLSVNLFSVHLTFNGDLAFAAVVTLIMHCSLYPLLFSSMLLKYYFDSALNTSLDLISNGLFLYTAAAFS